MMDSCFLCLDLGTCGVRGIAYRIKNAEIDKTAYYSVDDFDTVAALKSVIDELEKQIGTYFDSAYITGDFGPSLFKMSVKNTVWSTDHKITPTDVKAQIAEIDAPDGFYPMHIFPLRYDTPKFRNMLSPIGHTDRQLISAFSAIFFDNEYMQKILGFLRHAHIQATSFYTPHFLANATMREKKQNIMFIDMGADQTTVSIWTDRGPVLYNGISIGGNDLTTEISTRLEISFLEAERIKRNIATLESNEMARFSPADPAYAFSCADVNEIVVRFYNDIVQKIKNDCNEYIDKYSPSQIIVGGGGARINGIASEITSAFKIPVVLQDPDAAVRALSEYIWKTQEPLRIAYIKRSNKIRHFTDGIFKIFSIFKFRRKKTKKQIINPVMPSTLCFDMSRTDTYTMFKSANITAIHVDIMDGLYVDEIAGGIEELHNIRTMWNGKLHVHLMTESPTIWAAGAIDAGADTIILSTNTVGLRKAVRIIRESGRRVGIALNPDSSVSLLKTILRDLDEVMVMAVHPGAAGQEFDKSILKKIEILAAARKKYNLKFKISVDGGINADTAKLCWAAGADMLISGSYLESASDFPLAVQSLLPSEK